MRMLAICGPCAPSGMIGVGPGLVGGTKGAAERLA